MKTLSYLNSLRTEVEESEEEDVSVIVVGVDMEYDCVVGEIFTRSAPLLPLPTFFFGGRRRGSSSNRFPLRSRRATPLLPLPTFFFGGRRGSSNGNGNRLPLRSRSALLRRFIE